MGIEGHCMTIYLTVAGTFIGVILGGLITWFWSKHYYKAASDELEKVAKGLKTETKKILDRTKMILDGLEIANLVTISRDAEGNPISYIIKIYAQENVVAQASTSPVLTEIKKREEVKKGGEPE